MSSLTDESLFREEDALFFFKSIFLGELLLAMLATDPALDRVDRSRGVGLTEVKERFVISNNYKTSTQNQRGLTEKLSR